MATDESKALSKERAATAECVNAQAMNHGLVLLPVRGLKKVKAVALHFVLAHNLMRMVRLATEMVGIGTKLGQVRPEFQKWQAKSRKCGEIVK